MNPTFSAGAMLRVCAYLLIGAVGGYFIYYAWPAYSQKQNEVPSGPRLRMDGSSVVYFIMDKWKQAYRNEKKVDLFYRSTGSTEGVNHVIDQINQVGFTSTPLTDEQRSQAKGKGGELVQVPVALIGVVPVYNLPSLLPPKEKDAKQTDGKQKDKDARDKEARDKEARDKAALKFSADVLAKIFLGKIDKWNHPELQELNPDVKLPDLKITVVRREDASGTTYTFANYLHGGSELWRKEMGAPSNKVNWPASTVPMQRNHGVAAFVKYTEGAIGYVELINAFALKLQYGEVQNKDKSAFVLAKPETMTAAAKAAHDAKPGEVPTDLTNQPGKDSYPICAVDWAVCYQSQPAADYQLVSDFMRWVTKEGQEYGKELQYAPLPVEYRLLAAKKLETLKSR